MVGVCLIHILLYSISRYCIYDTYLEGVCGCFRCLKQCCGSRSKGSATFCRIRIQNISHGSGSGLVRFWKEQRRILKKNLFFSLAKKFWIRIRISMKSRIRIRICIKTFWIRHTGLKDVQYKDCNNVRVRRPLSCLIRGVYWVL